MKSNLNSTVLINKTNMNNYYLLISNYYANFKILTINPKV